MKSFFFFFLLLIQWNHYNKVLGTKKITLLYQVSHYIWVKTQRNIKSWDQQNYLVIRGFCYIRPLYNEVPLYSKIPDKQNFPLPRTSLYRVSTVVSLLARLEFTSCPTPYFYYQPFLIPPPPPQEKKKKKKSDL